MASFKWTGNGDGTSWTDPQNWLDVSDPSNTSSFPQGNDGATFETNASLTQGGDALIVDVEAAVSLSNASLSIDGSPGPDTPLVIGATGTGILTLANSASVTLVSLPGWVSLALGALPGSDGTLVMTGNSTLSAGGGTGIGGGGDASVSLTDGAQLTTQGLSITAPGEGSWNGVQFNPSGTDATATVVIASGASLTDIGGGMEMDGAGSQLTVDSAGTLNVDENGILLAVPAGTTDTVTVEGEGSTLTDGGQLVAGEGGAAVVNISDGAAVSIGGQANADSLQLGLNDGGMGTMSVTGADTVVSVSGQVDVGVGGTGSLTLQNGASMTTGDASGATAEGIDIGEAAGGSGTFLIDGADTQLTNTGQMVVGDDGTGTLTIDDGAQVANSIDANLQTPALTVANGQDSTGTVAVSGADTSLDIDGDVVVGNAGSGSLSLQDGASMTTGELIVGNQDASEGNVLVSGNGSMLTVNGGATIGGMTPDQSNPINAADGNWTYSGGTGSLTVSDGAAVTIGGGLTLQDEVEIGSGGSQTATGGVDIVSGGSIDIGGDAAAPANNLQIGQNGFVVGHGLISSTVTGQVPVSDSTTTPTYSLSINNNGTIEADDGTLALDGNLSGDGQVLVGPNSTVVFGGSVADDVTAMFLPGGSGTIAIDDPNDFQGVISDENLEPGDAIDLPNVPYISPGPDDLNPDGASYNFETGEGQQNYVLQVVENDQTYNIPISQDEPFEGSFVLTDDGHGGTLVTYRSEAEAGYSVTAIADEQPLDDAGVVKIIFVNRQTGRIDYSGTGFGVGPNLILTAAHVAATTNYNPLHDIMKVYLPGIGGPFDAKLITSGETVTLSGVGSDLHAVGNYHQEYDWAYVYVNDINGQHPFDETTGFFAPRTYTPTKTATITGYPNGGDQQKVDSSIIPQSNPFLLGTSLLANTMTGESGGPVWVTNQSSHRKDWVGVHLGAGVALSEVGIRKPIELHLPYVFFRDPPSNEARITSAVVIQTGDADTGQTVQFDLNLSENVTVTGSGPTLTLNDGGTATYDAANSVGDELEFDYTVGASDHTSNLEITQVNSAQTVQAPGGANIDFTVLENLPTDLSINSPLVVTSIAASQTGEVGTAQLVRLTLTMNEAVIVNTAGGAPTLWLNDSETATYDAAASNPSAGTLVFDYTVASGDETANLEVTSVNLPSGTTIQDASGNNADFSAAVNAPTGLQVDPAYITAINSSQSGDLMTGQTVQLTLAMSQGVTVNTTGDSPSLSLSDGASATYDAAASNPSAGNLVFDYTVSSGDYTTDLQVLNYTANGASVTDAHGVNADLSGATQYDLALDVNAAVVTNLAVSPSTGEVDSGQFVTLTLIVSEAVAVNTSGGSPTLSLNDGGTATYDSAASNPSAGTLVFEYTVGATGATPSLQITQVNLNGATIDDTHGNAADLSAAANFTTNLQIGPAFVSSVTPALSGEIFTGQTDQLTLAMSQAVTVNTAGGSPMLILSDGATATYDSVASDPSSGNPVFDYTVGASDYTTDLQVVGYNANGATVTDANGVSADFSAAAQNLSLDVNAATITGVTASPSSGEAHSSQSVTVTLTMSEAVTVNTGGGSPTLSLSTGATATYDSAAANPSAGTLVFDYTVGAADETPDLSVIQVNLNGAAINDGNGNAADLSAVSNFDTGLQVGPVFVDSLSASLSGNITTGQTVQLTVAMSGDLTVNTTDGPPFLILSNGATATYDGAASSPADGTLVFDYTVGAGDYATDLTVIGYNPNGATITDANGVSPDFSGVAQFDPGLDVNAAVVTNVTASPSTGEASSGQQVKLTLTMSEAVTVNATNGSPTLDLSDGATATYDSAASNPSAGMLVFDYTVGATDEDPSLQIAQVNLNGATIDDANGNPADLFAATTMATGLQIGPVFVNSLTASQTGDVTTGQTVQLTLALSGDVAILPTGSAPTLTLNDGAIATYDTANSTPSAGSLVFDYTVGSSDQTPDLEVTGVNLNGDTIQDGNGVDVDLSGALDSPTDLTINSPFVVNLVTTSQVGQSAQFTLSMSEHFSIDPAQGLPTLTLSDGTVATYDAVNSDPSSGTLVFDDTLPPNEQASTLQIAAVKLNGAPIEEANGNNANFSTAVAPSVNFVGSGETIIVPWGVTSTGLEIANGGLVQVEKGGTTSFTMIFSGGSEIVSAGGEDDDARMFGGEQDVWGLVSNARVNAGLEVIETGGTASSTNLSGGSEIVSTGGTDLNARLVNGVQDVFGLASGAIINGASQIIESGATASSTTLNHGSEIVSGGGTDFGAQLFGGEQDVFGLAISAVVNAGSQVVEAGGAATSTTLNGGSEIVGSSGTDFGAQVLGGKQDVFGSAIGAVAFAGSQVIEAGATASITTLNGGDEVVSAGGTDFLAQISAGEQEVFGVAIRATIFSGGSQLVGSGIGANGTATSTTIDSGGEQLVGELHGTGTATSTTISQGGTQLVGYDYGSGTATDTTIDSGGVQLVGELHGTGTATSTTINYSGAQWVGANGGSGTATSTTIIDGGIQFVGDFYGSGGTAISTTISDSGAQIVGYYGGSGTASSTTINSGGRQLVGDLFGGSGMAASTTINDSGLQVVGYNYGSGTATSTTINNGGLQQVGTIDGSGTATSTTISVGGSQYVGYNYGSGAAISTTINGDGVQRVGYVSGSGAATSTTIDYAGFQYVGDTFGSGTATSTIINGGYQYVGYNAGTGTATSTTINEYGQQIVGYYTINNNGGQGGSGTATGTAINSGGTQYVGYYYGSGTATSTTINSGGMQIIGDESGSGIANSTTINAGGEQFVGYLVGYGTAAGTTINSGGTQLVGGYFISGRSSGTATGTTVNSGGTQLVGYNNNSGTAVDTVLSGGTEYVSAGGVATGVTFAGTSGTLALTQPQGLSGTISGWQVGDVIDFVSTSITSASISGSTLMVTVSGGASFAYQLAGQEANTNANTQSDGSGGTQVTLAQPGSSVSADTNASWREGSAPTTVSPHLTVTDSTSTNLISATVAITSNKFAGDGDVLGFNVSGTSISESYNSGTETLTLSGTDTLAHYQSVLEGVTFSAGANPTDFGADPSRTVTWTVNDGSSTANATTTITILPTTIYVASGHTSSGLTISGGITLDILSGGTALATTVTSGGTELVQSGGSASGSIIDSGGTEIVSGGGTDLGALISGGTQLDYGYASGATVFGGGSQGVQAGGLASATVVSAGATMVVSSGGSGSAAMIASAGTEFVQSGALDSGALVSGGTNVGGNQLSGADQDVTGTAVSATIGSGGFQTVEFGGRALATTVNPFGEQDVNGGGTASGAIVSGSSAFDVVRGLALGARIGSNGDLIVLGGTASGTTISGGGLQTVALGTASGTIIQSGGLEYISSGGGRSISAQITGSQAVFGSAVSAPSSAAAFRTSRPAASASPAAPSSAAAARSWRLRSRSIPSSAAAACRARAMRSTARRS